MQKDPNKLLFISGAGAELTWLYAWASFLIFSSFKCLYPLPAILGLFSLAAFLTNVHHKRPWRVIQIIGIHLTGLTCAGLWVVSAFYYPSSPLMNAGWLSDFFNRPRDPIDWFQLVFVLGYTILFWSIGVWFTLQKKSYTVACTRFDRGVAAFFSLLLIKLVLHTQMGVQFNDSMTVWLVFPFFIFSLMEIGLTRNRGDLQQADYLSGYSAIGVFAGFSIGALIIGTGVFLLFLPYLQTASAAGYDLMKNAAGYLSPVLIAVIRFIFGYAKFDQQDPGLSSGIVTANNLTPDEPAAWILFIQKALMWWGGVLLLVLGSVIAGLVLWYGAKWLFMKRNGGTEKSGQLSLLLGWNLLKAFLIAIYQRILDLRVQNSAFEFYVALRRWGRYCGMPPATHETPMEYGTRLARRFPEIKTEILLIVKMLHWEIYGEYSCSPKEIMRTRQAWKKLSSPLKWPMRLKSIFSDLRSNHGTKQR